MINPAIQEVLPILVANWWVIVLVAIIAGIIYSIVPRYGWGERE